MTRSISTSDLHRIAHSRRFWENCLWLREGRRKEMRYPELDGELRFEVGSGYAFVLTLEEGLGYFDLSLETPDLARFQLGWDDQAHWHPHVLRWEELDLVCRALAASNPELGHPGVALLMLQRFAPICTDDDARVAFPLLEAAWDCLGVFVGRQRDRLIEHFDVRGQGFVWTCNDGRWMVAQDDEDAQHGLYSLRCAENTEFPFEALAGALAAAERTAGPPSSETATRTTNVRPRRRVEQARIDVPIQARGFAIPGSAGAFYAAAIDAALRCFDSGSAESGGSESRFDPVERVTEETWHLRVLLESDLDLGWELVQSVLLWSRAPGECVLHRGSAWGSGPGDLRLADCEVDPSPCVWVRRCHVEQMFYDGPIVHYVDDPLQPDGHAWRLVARADAPPDVDGNFRISFADGGRIRIRFAGDYEEPDGFDCAFQSLSLEACGAILDVSRGDELLISPMMVTASTSLSARLAGVWPGTRCIESAAEFLAILQAGPRRWWDEHGVPSLPHAGAEPPESPRRPWWKLW